MNVARTRRMAPVPRSDVVGARLGRALLLLVSLGWAVPVLGAEEKPEPTPPSSEPMSAPSQPAPPPSDAATSASGSTTPPAELPPRRDVPNYRQLDSEPTTAGRRPHLGASGHPPSGISGHRVRAARPVGGSAPSRRRTTGPGPSTTSSPSAPTTAAGSCRRSPSTPVPADHRGPLLLGRHVRRQEQLHRGRRLGRLGLGPGGARGSVHVLRGDWIALQAQWQRRPDYVYFGIGPDTSDDFRSRYGTDQIEGG
jgi:hypothetical protein